MQYPPPSYAATIWITDETIWLGMPGTGPGERGHTAHFPADEYGMKLLRLTLKERARASHERLKIGHKAAPIQYDLDAIYQRLKQSEGGPSETKAPELPTGVKTLLRRKLEQDSGGR